MLASKSKDFPHPSFPTMMTLLFFLSQCETISMSFLIYFVGYICWMPVNSSSLYSLILPLFILKERGSLPPGTAFSKTNSNISPRVYWSKLDASPFTKFNLNYC